MEGQDIVSIARGRSAQMVSTDHMHTEASTINLSFFVAPTPPARLQRILIGFDPDRSQCPTCHEARANCDVSVTMVSCITCRMIECRLQIAIGTTDPKSTVSTRPSSCLPMTSSTKWRQVRGSGLRQTSLVPSPTFAKMAAVRER